MRRLLSVLGVVLVLSVAWVGPVAADPPSPANPAGPPERVLGIVPVHDQAHGARPGPTSNLSYHGGPVMLSGNRTYTIFWAGSNPNWGDSGYIPTIQGYFANVAADSGHSNVYATDTQYYDTSNAHIANSSTLGPSTTDTTPYPANGCTDKATTICLSDLQLQKELKNVMALKGWTAKGSDGVQNLFFIFTPKGVGSCAGSSCAYSSYCAYHSWINDAGGAILYANQPYAAQNYRIYTCDSGQHPNGTTADATLNVVSHEHNEAITDAQGSAWFDSQGAENGDKCAWNFGTVLGNKGSGQYNQVIGTGKYYLQQEWSNSNSGCRLTY